MKAVFTSICISIVLVSIAQDEDKMVEAMMTAPGMEIKSSSVKLQKESRPALTAYVNGETSKVEKKWKKYLAEACGCALKRNKGFYEGLGVQLPTVTMETISIFTRVEDDDDGARLDVAVDFGGKF